MDKIKLFASLDENNVVENYSTINYSYRVMEYGDNDTLSTNNSPQIGAKFDEELNAFISPKPDPTYILNTETFQWEPDKTLEYDLYGDGTMYKWSEEEQDWVPIENTQTSTDTTNVEISST